MRILTSLFCLFIISCSSEGSSRPDGMIEEEKMAEIMVDIHLAEARVANVGLRSIDSSVIVYSRLKEDIWKKYDVDTASYNATYRYIASNPEIMARVYERVTKELSAKDSSTVLK